MRVEFNRFELEYLNKEATLMTVGNGYLGLRSTHEENYHHQNRGFFIRGVYSKAVDSEAAEIVNLPDTAEIELYLNGELFSLSTGEVRSYKRFLDLETGELTRFLCWQSEKGQRFNITNKRVVNQVDQHQIAYQLIVEPLDGCCEILLKTGINGQVTNSGHQHLIEKAIRVVDERILAAEYMTISSEINIGMSVSTNIAGKIEAKNRKFYTTIKQEVTSNQKFTFEKSVYVYTSLDVEEPFAAAKLAVKKVRSYEEVLQQSISFWQSFWENQRVEVESNQSFDQFALDFACYHLQIMTPDDSRFSVGAKGLTGEGYKGHVFWDTEIFIFPFFLHNQPKMAEKLLKYRYRNLAGALEKARLNGYQGALFPWESALTGYEETPKYAAINIRTGERQLISSAIAEHHIVADIAYAVLDYNQSTKDKEFMEKYGKQLLYQTALFWLSRVQENEGRFEINDVIGPDEYTEHVNNNAYTNYMAALNVSAALRFSLGDEVFQEQCQTFLERIYLPDANQEGIIPQDDSFLEKPSIDLAKYKEKAGSQLILTDYSRQEVIDQQILKQADLVMLFYLQPHLFASEVMKKNLAYYEKRTIHDSSLSKAIHAIVAARTNEIEWAYELFQSACKIDLSDEPHSSDDGIHAASLGAVWLATIFGFAGITKGEILEIQPCLPKNWKRLRFKFKWQDETLSFDISQKKVTIKKSSDTEIPIIIAGNEQTIKHELNDVRS